MRLTLLTLILLSCEDGKGGIDSGVVGSTGLGVDEDGDGFVESTECNDRDASVNPGVVELCDGIDNDCDGEIDEGVTTTFYEDADGDGFGDAGSEVQSCATAAGLVTNDSDCDDTDAALHPGASETCDGIDNDCDGETDEDGQRVWYVDADGDGWGDRDATIEDCAQPSGATSEAGDCDDADPDAWPGNEEVCDEIDNDCDGEVDEGVRTIWYLDSDGDGYGVSGSTAESCEPLEGYAEEDGDCDDEDVAFHPGAEESDCTDPNDYNCDGSVGYSDNDGDGWAACEECDDAASAINPDAVEVCNELDDDCDGDIDDDDFDVDTSTMSEWYADADEDGFGDADSTTESCAEPEGYTDDDTDCDDTDADISPDGSEVCNGVDDDCDGDIDDADPDQDMSTTSVWYADADGDGYGDSGDTTQACAEPSGYTGDSTDCDDTDSGINPASTEICDSSSPGVDDDCDGLIDDDDPSLEASSQSSWYADTDADGFGDPDAATAACEAPSGTVSDDTDCDDGDSAVNPNAVEICNDIDDDCDGDIDDDDADRSTAGASTFYTDSDGDGFGDPGADLLSCEQPSGAVADDTDCDDTDSAVNPDATEVCNPSGAAVDDDCDGLIDDDDSSLDLSTATTWYGDGDSDGYGDSAVSTQSCEAPTGMVDDDTDCDDSSAAVSPADNEICNGIDDDCDGDIDDADSGVDLATAGTWYADGDGDGHGDSSSTAVSCDATSGFVADSSDCDDADGAIHPAASEACDAIDNDCDGSVDEGVTSSFYADSDGDGYGDAASSTEDCSAPSGHVSDDSDCDDTDSGVSPSASEICNDIDDDCDGDIDDADSSVDTSTGQVWYLDSDGDGYGTSTSSTWSCDTLSGYASATDDCDDGDAGVNPGAAEVCVNSTDEDCDGSYSEGCPANTLSCGGPSTMDPGHSHSCSIGTTAWVDSVYISVGCNDGETGSYSVYFDDGSAETFSASCGSTHSFSGRLTNNMTIYMNSGGGGDNHISFTCCGSGGWGAYYY